MEVIAIFDVGKTNKKFLLFDSALNVVHVEEHTFTEAPDDDGYPGDDITEIESWMRRCLAGAVREGNYKVRALNFTTYGATLVHLDHRGRRITPVYNYLKPMPSGVLDGFYESWGGEQEFCRRTASPALGMLNSGLQILWLKRKKPALFSQIASIMHLPQYLSWLFTGRVTSEHTSIGCHTAMWDFDRHDYHPWLKAEGITLPQPAAYSLAIDAFAEGQQITAGIGVHDSSAALVPYLKATKEQFILISSGTWCIFMNPFNDEPLTTEQLQSDTLCYMSINQKQVKASRLFLGHIHDRNVERLNDHYGVTDDLYKTIEIKPGKLSRLLTSKRGRVFFRHGVPNDYVDREVSLFQFLTFADAYHQMVFDLVDLCMESYRLIIPADDRSELVYIAGGFANNDTFVRSLAARLPAKRIFTSEITDPSALGAAMAVYENAFGSPTPTVYLGLRSIHNSY